MARYVGKHEANQPPKRDWFQIVGGLISAVSGLIHIIEFLRGE